MTVSSGHEAAAGGVVGGVRRHAAKCADRQGQERSDLIANNVLYDGLLCSAIAGPNDEKLNTAQRRVLTNVLG